LERGEPIAPAVRARALLAAGTLAVWVEQDVDHALRRLDEGETIARAIDDRHSLAAIRFWRGAAAEEFGDDLAETLAHHEEALALNRDLADPFGIALSLIEVSEAAYNLGDVVRATALRDEGLALSRRIGAAFLLALGLPGAVEMRLTQNRVDQALSLGHEAVQRSGDFGPACIANALTGAAAVATARGHPQQAARLLGAVQTLVAQMGRQFAPATYMHRRVMAAARAGLDEPAWEAACAEGRTFSRDEATAEAFAATTEAGAGVILRSQVNAADAVGLTAREREILRLVVDGKSNPEIGTRLFISHRTVATHLRNVYDKLGVTGRAEAISAAIRRDLI
jgi:DNA-binding CsgD family transcriptional regulator